MWSEYGSAWAFLLYFMLKGVSFKLTWICLFWGAERCIKSDPVNFQVGVSAMSYGWVFGSLSLIKGGCRAGLTGAKLPCLLRCHYDSSIYN